MKRTTKKNKTKKKLKKNRREIKIENCGTNGACRVQWMNRWASQRASDISHAVIPVGGALESFTHIPGLEGAGEAEQQRGERERERERE